MSSVSHLMTEMETLSILFLWWLRWKEVSTLTTSNIEFVRAATSISVARCQY